jgi:hypothetical protein
MDEIITFFAALPTVHWYIILTIAAAVFLTELLKLAIERHRQKSVISGKLPDGTEYKKLVKTYQAISFILAAGGAFLWLYLFDRREFGIAFGEAVGWGGSASVVYLTYQDWGIRGLLRKIKDWYLANKDKKIADAIAAENSRNAERAKMLYADTKAELQAQAPEAAKIITDAEAMAHLAEAHGISIDALKSYINVAGKK